MSRKRLDLAVADPVHVAKLEARLRERRAGSDDHPRPLRIEADDIERLSGRDAEPAPLADRVMDDARMPAEDAPVDMDDIARLGSLGHQALDHVAVASGGDEADVLAVRLVGVQEPVAPRKLAGLDLGKVAERKAKAGELLPGRREQEIALVALGVGRAVERPSAASVVARDHVMPGRQQVGAEILGGVEQIGEFHVLVAGDAGYRRLAGNIGAREGLDHLFAKALLVVEHVMGNADPRRDVAGVVDILPRAAGPLPVGRLAVVVELHGDADDVIALGGQRGRHNGGIRRRPTWRRPRACRLAACRGLGNWARRAKPARAKSQTWLSYPPDRNDRGSGLSDLD